MAPAMRSALHPVCRLGLGLVAVGLLLNVALVVLLLGDAVRPGHISLSAIAIMATLGGVLLVAGLALADPGPNRR
ncbi:MAG TPA: hypothetical protein VD970_16815 [Acetobacteraceae bacterium]|nr:hypothetical protein [Acetobacteraceae bacterium]